MDDLDIWSIQSVIESKTGSMSSEFDYDFDPNRLLRWVLITGPSNLGIDTRQFSVFKIHKGVPDLFTLTGYASPVICYHIGYVGKFTKFRNYIMDDPEKNSIDTLGIANLFELVSSLYLQAGNYSFATLTLLQSIIETPFRVTDEEVYGYYRFLLHTSCFAERCIREDLFTMFYFGLAHEIGHTYADDAIRSGKLVHQLPLTADAISETIVRSARSCFGEEGYFFDKWHQEHFVKRDSVRSILNPDNLRSEILADSIGVNILHLTFNALSSFLKEKVSFKKFVCEAIVGLFVVELMEACKYIVNTLPSEQKNDNLIDELLGIPIGDQTFYAKSKATNLIVNFQIAHFVRWEYLKPSLTNIIIHHLFPDTVSFEEGDAKITCSQEELQRRLKIANVNVDNYRSFYNKEIGKLQIHLADVIDFVGHMATCKASDLHRSPSENSTFSEQIKANFDEYLNRLTGDSSSKRRQEIAEQLTEFKLLLEQRNDADNLSYIRHILDRLQN